MKVIYPLADLKVGEAFFVPGLDVQKVKEGGMSAALQYRYRMKAVVGIKEGRLGVLFVRQRGGLTRLKRS
jgi:hypothetical protein